jgi:hypothetical protein
LRAKEEELDLNRLGKRESELVEERKTLKRLKSEFRDGMKSIWAAPQWKLGIIERNGVNMGKAAREGAWRIWRSACSMSVVHLCIRNR